MTFAGTQAASVPWLRLSGAGAEQGACPELQPAGASSSLWLATAPHQQLWGSHTLGYCHQICSCSLEFSPQSAASFEFQAWPMLV